MATEARGCLGLGEFEHHADGAPKIAPPDTSGVVVNPVDLEDADGDQTAHVHIESAAETGSKSPLRSSWDVSRTPAGETVYEGRGAAGAELEARSKHVLVKGKRGSSNALVLSPEVEHNPCVLGEVVIHGGLPAS